MKKNIAYIIITSLLVSFLFICFSTTVYSQVKEHQIASDKHQLDQFESVYIKSMKSTMDKHGCVYSGITMTKVYELDGTIAYNVKIHHSQLSRFSDEELLLLEQDLRCGLGDLADVTFAYEFSF